MCQYRISTNTHRSHLQRAIPIVYKWPQISCVRVETSHRGCILFSVESEMPFPYQVSAITGFLEVFRHNLLIQSESPWFVGVNYVVLHAVIDGMFTGHQGSSRWCTHGSSVMSIQDDTIVSQSIDVGRGNLIRAVEANVINAHVVCHDYDYVGPLGTSTSISTDNALRVQ